MEDVSIDDLSSQYGVIALEGPNAEDVMWRIFSTGPFPKDALQFFEREFDKTNVFLFKHSVTGEDGYHLMIPAEHVESLRDYLVQASRGSDGLPVGGIAWNMRRVECGLPWYGVDFDGDNFPDEARLGSTVNYTKGCFLGQETLARLHHRGHVNRMLVGLSVDDDAVPEDIRKFVDEFEGEKNNFDEVGLKEKARSAVQVLNVLPRSGKDSELFPTTGEDSAKAIGRITSVTFSPQLKTLLFLGYVRRELVEQNQPVCTNDKLTLTPVELPITG
jgi:folate-binding protein YgfZ